MFFRHQAAYEDNIANAVDQLLMFYNVTCQACLSQHYSFNLLAIAAVIQAT